MTGGPLAGIDSWSRSTVPFLTTWGALVAGSSTSGPGTSKPAMLTKRVAVEPWSTTAIFPHGPSMFGPAHAVASRPLASSTSRQPLLLVRVVPSLLGVLPTMTQPALSIVIAVVSPTPPGALRRVLRQLR